MHIADVLNDILIWEIQVVAALRPRRLRPQQHILTPASLHLIIIYSYSRILSYSEPSLLCICIAYRIYCYDRISVNERKEQTQCHLSLSKHPKSIEI